ncbi:hypothetical protein GGR92_000185 [Spirosoma lacussanchae]|uniref:hypothetical protein n=1 Tax=Spirosoma lacussanchae TaxID=1884249 RepID=UPI001108D0FA|nr:hypothetical protein [Spirosoma lacussanchae]
MNNQIQESQLGLALLVIINGMVTDIQPQAMRQLCPLLRIDDTDKDDTVIQILFWKALYEQTVAYVDQLHGAFDRLVTSPDETLEGVCQREADMALFINPFLTGQPFNIISYLQQESQLSHRPLQDESAQGHTDLYV